MHTPITDYASELDDSFATPERARHLARRLELDRAALMSMLNEYELEFHDEAEARAEFGDARIERELRRRSVLSEARNNFIHTPAKIGFTERMAALDPGEGYRLVLSGELLEAGDEWFLPGPRWWNSKRWVPSGVSTEWRLRHDGIGPPVRRKLPEPWPGED